MKDSGRIGLCTIFIAVSTTAVAGYAEPGFAEGQPLEEIVVTAQRREQAVTDVPMTVNAFTRADFEALRISGPESLAAMVPAYTFTRTWKGTPVHTIRGIGFDGINTSSKSSVGMYADQVGYAVPFMSQHVMFDLERVELLKGPQGTLYGRNTTAGLINYIAAKPTDEFDASVAATVGNYQTFDIEGHVSGPLGEALAGRLAFRKLDANKGWQKSISRGDRLGEKDVVALRGILEWTPTERFDTTLAMSHWRDRSDTQAAQSMGHTHAPAVAAFLSPAHAQSIPPNPSNADADWDPPGHDAPPANLTAFKPSRPEHDDTSFFGAALNVRYGLTDVLGLHSMTAYQRGHYEALVEADGTPVEDKAPHNKDEVRSFQQELRLQGEHLRGSWTVGLFYADDNLEDRRDAWFGDSPSILITRFFGVNVLPALVPGPLPLAEIAVGLRTARSESEQDVESKAVFAHADYDLNDSLTLAGGLRYTKEETSFEGCTRDTYGNYYPIQNHVISFFFGLYPLSVERGGCTTIIAGTATTGLVEDRLEEDNVSGNLSISWAAADSLTLYATAARGFKSGQFPNVGANVSTQSAPTTQEELWSYEAGIKANWGRVQSNGSIYYYDFEDKQVYALVADAVYNTLERLVNVPESEVRGAEVDVAWRPDSWFWLKLAAAYTDSEIEGSFLAFDEFGVPQDFAGNELARTPEWQITGQLGLSLALNHALGLRGVLSTAWQSEGEGTVSNLPMAQIDSYTITNANLTLHGRTERWSAELWAQNLFDEDYWHGSTIVSGTASRWTGIPRTYGLTLRYGFE